MTVSASLVKQLRDQTGVGMMECKRALEQTNGDLAAAITLMRKSGQAKAAKKSERVAAEGRVVLKIAAHEAAILEVNCETDFASRDENFIAFCEQACAQVLAQKISQIVDLMPTTGADGKTITEHRDWLVGKIGENIQVRRLGYLTGTGYFFAYVHGNGKIGVLVELDCDEPELGKDLAMHIAACKPVAIQRKEIASEVVAQEREIYLAQMANSGKSAEMLEKIVSGKLNKFIDENVLEGQAFVKDPAIKVETLLQQKKARVLQMLRFEVGEGIEKNVVDFAAEVEAQTQAANQ